MSYLASSAALSSSAFSDVSETASASTLLTPERVDPVPVTCELTSPEAESSAAASRIVAEAPANGAACALIEAPANMIPAESVSAAA